ncbi:MAG TPA: hypothetical protein VH349_14540 [Ktedonobacterales bacterium]|jgi:hypothetical protein
MPYDEFDVYKTAIEDTNELLRRRGDADNLYVGIVTVILTGEAYLFVTSQFDSWLPVIATAAASLVGLAIVRRWSQGFAEISRILDKRFEFLRKLEATETLQRIGATAFTEEYPFYTRSRRKRRGLNSYLQWVFGLVFVLIPLFLALATLARLTPELQPLYYYIQPLAPAPTTLP